MAVCMVTTSRYALLQGVYESRILSSVYIYIYCEFLILLIGNSDVPIPIPILSIGPILALSDR